MLIYERLFCHIMPEITVSLHPLVPEIDINPSADTLDDLKQAFGVFNEMSEQLTQSYQLLEDRVIELSGELASMSEQRMKELAEKERLAGQLESLLNMMPAGVVVLDKKGRIQRSNPAADQLLEASIVGKSWRKVIAGALDPKADDGHEISLKSGKLVSLATTALEGAGQLVLLNDMTETRKLQQQMARQDRLSAMGKMVASLAHQIRTPLSAAMLYAGNLEQESITPVQRKKFVGKIKSRLAHLEQQVRDMLIFVRGETRLVDELDAGELIFEIQQLSEAVARSSGSTVQFTNQTQGELFLCNKDALTGAILNLINNAIESCAPDAAEILVNVACREQQFYISVCDNGPGIPADTLKQITEPFYTTKSHGTGLGLPVVSAVAKAHKGRLDVVSQISEGSIFTLSLPVMDIQENAK